MFDQLALFFAQRAEEVLVSIEHGRCGLVELVQPFGLQYQPFGAAVCRVIVPLDKAGGFLRAHKLARHHHIGAALLDKAGLGYLFRRRIRSRCVGIIALD